MTAEQTLITLAIALLMYWGSSLVGQSVREACLASQMTDAASKQWGFAARRFALVVLLVMALLS